MQQTLTFIFLIILLFLGCETPPICRNIVGTWTDGEGQEILFLENGTALWLTRFGSRADTLHFAYQLLCKNTPAELNWSNFSGGPYSGRTLYGIVEWLSDSTFRFRYEPGYQPDVRPKVFDTVHTLRFVKQ